MPSTASGCAPRSSRGYRELTRLRYDYPVVLVENATGHDCVRSLSSLVDGVLRELAPRGIEGERLRRHGLQLEREIRVLLAEGANWTLSELWAMAAARLGARSGETLEQVLVHAATALKADGAVLDCTHGMAPQFIRHAWRAAQEDRARAFREQMGRLAVKLTDILRAAFVHSEAGRRPASLKAAVGTSHGDEFDFSVMSKLIGKGAAKDELPPTRRKRIEWALNVLRSQRFYAVPGGDDQGPAPHEFAFENCAAAAAAFRARVPEMVELVKAMSIAELETDGRYVEAKDDPFFAAFDEASLGAGEIALFPDYLVCIPPAHNDAPENAALMEMLSAGLPLKVLVETTDLVEDATLGAQHFAFGVRSARLANTATALGGVFVVQTASSNLYALRGAHRAGLRAPRRRALQHLLRRGRALGRLATLPRRRRGDGVARFPGVHLRPVRRRQPGGALRPRGQPAGRGRLAGRAVRVRRRESAARGPDPRLHLRRLRALRQALRGALRPRAARAVERRHDPGGRMARAQRQGRHGQGAVHPRRGPRQRPAPRPRRRAAHAGRAALPDLLAPAAGTGRHPQLDRR